jgi:Fe-S oxidoreductase
LYDFGLLDSAREHLEGVFRTLAEPLQARTPVVVLEPSCFSTFKDEAVNLFPDEPLARALSEQVALLETFLQPHFERGDLPQLSGDALVHVHCHQQALSDRDSASEAFGATGLDTKILDAGCCGLAGSFGFDKHHYEVSVDIGERVLLPAVRRAAPSTTVIANGFSCREQIRHLAGGSAQHIAEVVRASLGKSS